MPLILLDFNAVIVYLDSLTPENKRVCLSNIENNVSILKKYIENNNQMKENISEIPLTGMAVLQQQFVLVLAIEDWIASLREALECWKMIKISIP